jgi:hypothetical protein
MQPVYRSAKLTMEQLKAGADFKEFNILRGNFATELSVIRDRISTGASAKEPLRKYYVAYQDLLGLYSFAADTWESKISTSQCEGPPPEEFSKDGDIAEAMEVMRSNAAFLKRVKACVDKESNIWSTFEKRAESLGVDCTKSIDSEGYLDCALKNAETKLKSAEALLLKH